MIREANAPDTSNDVRRDPEGSGYSRRIWRFMKRRARILCIGVVVLIVGSLGLFGVSTHREKMRLQVKAEKFDDYCRQVRGKLEGFAIVLEEPKSRYQRRVINSFYDRTLFEDQHAVDRCALRAIEPSVDERKARCDPPPSCLREPLDAPQCQIDAACARGVVAELIELLPKTRP
jgi:hypothetical protein